MRYYGLLEQAYERGGLEINGAFARRTEAKVFPLKLFNQQPVSRLHATILGRIPRLLSFEHGMKEA